MCGGNDGSLLQTGMANGAAFGVRITRIKERWVVVEQPGGTIPTLLIVVLIG